MVDESATQPSDRQPVGRFASGVGSAVDEDVKDDLLLLDALEIEDDPGLVVVDEPVDTEVELLVAGWDVLETVDEEEGEGKASEWNRLILFEPPQMTFKSPPHRESQPLAMGTRLEVVPHQHCVPYSTPAHIMPLPEQVEIHIPTVKLLNAFVPPSRA